jgi:hypothetical protein
MTESIEGSKESKAAQSEVPVSGLSVRLPEEQKPKALSPKRSRFTKDTINDLIFWGAHLCIVAIALAMVWGRIDRLTHAIAELVKYTAKEDAQRATEVSAMQETLKEIIRGTNNNFITASAARQTLYDSITKEIDEAAKARDELLNRVNNAESEVTNSVQVMISSMDEMRGELESKVAKIQIDVAASLLQINKIAEQIGATAQQKQQDAQAAQAEAQMAHVAAAKVRGALAHKTHQLSKANTFIQKQQKRNVIERIFNTHYIGVTK